HPHRRAVVASDTGQKRTWQRLDLRAAAVAGGLAALGVRPGDPVALLARNSPAYVEAVAALGRLGADVVHVNTGFAGPQLAAVLDGQGVTAVLHDEEFAADLATAGGGRLSVITDAALPRTPPAVRGAASLEQLVAAGAPAPPPPGRQGRQVILTSGTTGTPKGAARSEATARNAAAFLQRVPLRAGRPIAVAAPLFHAWGFAGLSTALALGAPMVVARRFEPEALLASIEAHRVDALIAVPVMLQRILDLPEPVRSRYDTRSLRVIAVSGSALPGDLATRFMDAYGDVLHNVYGSTEVAYAAIATPADLRADPGTAGRPVRGTRVEVLDDAGHPVPRGTTGRIFVGSDLVFSGYTDGRDRERVRGLVSTGDTGRFDARGRLRVEGRSDDMIVSGGENVFPGEVEDVLCHHPEVEEVAVVGVPDEVFGQALVAHVVLRRGAAVTPEGLQAHVRRQLARFKVPREVVLTDRLPRNETGKVLRGELGPAPGARESRQLS
ncbi:MAG: AMP-binding protein, partial [Actinomycetota bacterium]|nr:AMP-binding protein [Actinomycetota bacterium]